MNWLMEPRDVCRLGTTKGVMMPSGTPCRLQPHGDAQSLKVFEHLLHGLIAVARLSGHRIIDHV